MLIQRLKSFKGPHNKGAWKRNPRNSPGREKNGFDPCSPTVSLDLTQNCPHTETKGEVETRVTSHPYPHQDVLQFRGRSAKKLVENQQGHDCIRHLYLRERCGRAEGAAMSLPWLPAFCSVETPCTPSLPRAVSSSITS